MSPVGCSDVTSLKGAQLKREQRRGAFPRPGSGRLCTGADVPGDTRGCRGHRAGDTVILELLPCLCRVTQHWPHRVPRARPGRLKR